MARGLLLATAIALVGWIWPVQAEDRAGEFDYYVLALSWSPTYCTTRNGRKDRRQCHSGRRFSFVVHGLWPQYENGWPDYCPTNRRYIPERRIREMLDIMPSKRLVIHQWRKHGTCSGLSQQSYFDLTRTLFDRFQVPARYVAPSRPLLTTPDELVHDFVTTNLWLKPEMMSVHCGRRRGRANLSELRVCFGKDLEPRACGQNARRACRAHTLVMPPVR